MDTSRPLLEGEVQDFIGGVSTTGDSKGLVVASGSFEIFSNGMINYTVRKAKGMELPDPLDGLGDKVHDHNTAICRKLNAALLEGKAASCKDRPDIITDEEC